MTEPLALQIQRLGAFNEQVLVLLQAAEFRDSSRSASPAEVANLFRALRLPQPRNERQHLGQLRANGLVMQPVPGRWAVTPEGREEITRLMGTVALEGLVPPQEQAREPLFAGAAHHLIPPAMGPAQFQIAISRILDESSFDQNIFCMTRYPEAEEDEDLPLARGIEIARQVSSSFGLTFHLASDRAVGDQLLENIGGYMWASRYGVAFLEAKTERGLNYNVMFEVGAMLATGRRCLLLRDVSIPSTSLPADLVGHIHRSVDLDDLSTVDRAVREWMAADLGFAT